MDMPANTEILRREDDRLMGQMLAELKSMNQQLQTVVNTINELRAGEIQLPQCRENARRIDTVEKKISEHSYNDLNRRLKILEDHEAERKDTATWTYRQLIGPVINVLVLAALAYMGMKK